VSNARPISGCGRRGLGLSAMRPSIRRDHPRHPVGAKMRSEMLAPQSVRDCAVSTLGLIRAGNPYKIPSECRSFAAGKPFCISIPESFFLLAFPNKSDGVSAVWLVASGRPRPDSELVSGAVSMAAVGTTVSSAATNARASVARRFSACKIPRRALPANRGLIESGHDE
jgi:hypothetical protein